METTSIISIIIILVLAYILLRFIVSPIIKILVGIVIFIVFIYLVQRFLGFNINQIFAPFGISLPEWNWDLGGFLDPLGQYIDKIKEFWFFLLGNLPGNNINN